MQFWQQAWHFDLVIYAHVWGTHETQFFPLAWIIQILQPHPAANFKNYAVLYKILEILFKNRLWNLCDKLVKMVNENLSLQLSD
jgi:hypothetical protein